MGLAGVGRLMPKPASFFSTDPDMASSGWFRRSLADRRDRRKPECAGVAGIPCGLYVAQIVRLSRLHHSGSKGRFAINEFRDRDDFHTCRAVVLPCGSGGPATGE